MLWTTREPNGELINEKGKSVLQHKRNCDEIREVDKILRGSAKPESESRFDPSELSCLSLAPISETPGNLRKIFRSENLLKK